MVLRWITMLLDAGFKPDYDTQGYAVKDADGFNVLWVGKNVLYGGDPSAVALLVKDYCEKARRLLDGESEDHEE
jgi:hypothetical protein